VDFDDTPQEAAYRTEVRSWLEQHAKPRDSQTAHAVMLTDAHSEAEREHVRASQEWQAVLYDEGWAGITWPKEFGGRGASAIEQIIFNQESSHFDVPGSVFAQGIGMAGPTLMAHGSQEQKDRFLRPMLRGEDLWCQLFSEPGAGSDLAGLATSAVRDGDEWVINGQKVWTSSAQYSDWGILLARTDPDVPKHRGITYFLVDMRSPGIDVRPLRQITGSAHFNEVFLTDVRIPDANRVGEAGDGWRITMTTLTSERTLIGGNQSDRASELIELARETGNAGDLLIRQQLAQVYIRQQLITYLGWRTLSDISQGRQIGPFSSLAKLALSAHLAHIGDLALELEGAAGMLMPESGDGNYWAQVFLGQWSSRIGGGTEQVQRNIIGERILGLPGEPRPDRSTSWRESTKLKG
jgi:alkylation response protein AidB-like acyl-CoA dehydrogenase